MHIQPSELFDNADLADTTITASIQALAKSLNIHQSSLAYLLNPGRCDDPLVPATTVAPTSSWLSNGIPWRLVFRSLDYIIPLARKSTSTKALFLFLGETLEALARQSPVAASLLERRILESVSTCEELHGHLKYLYKNNPFRADAATQFRPECWGRLVVDLVLNAPKGQHVFEVLLQRISDAVVAQNPTAITSLLSLFPPLAPLVLVQLYDTLELPQADLLAQCVQGVMKQNSSDVCDFLMLLCFAHLPLL